MKQTEQNTEKHSATDKSVSELKAQTYPLELVLRACPDLQAYAGGEIRLWKDFITVTTQIRGYLGISPSAYQQAVTIFGQQNAAIIIACMLQRLDHIQSAGGYLRNLTNKAAHQAFSVGPMLMSLLRSESHKSHMN